jgi:hypothetical protein
MMMSTWSMPSGRVISSTFPRITLVLTKEDEIMMKEFKTGDLRDNALEAVLLDDFFSLFGDVTRFNGVDMLRARLGRE